MFMIRDNQDVEKRRILEHQLTEKKLFSESTTQQNNGSSQLEGAGAFAGCALTGIHLSNGHNLANLGAQFLDLVANLGLTCTQVQYWCAG